MARTGGIETFDHLRLALDRYKEIQTAVVIEDFKPVGRIGLAIEEYSHQTARHTYYTRSAALGAIRAYLKGD
jgi:spore maturation protein CgeB